MKADWNNYSESRSLKQAVEEYKETFGFYPKTILADRAYPGRENRLWCTSLGIRLSGPRLGRKSAEEKQTESKQIYQDGCDRVVIEGTFGVVKRRYSLDRVMTRLPDTSMTSIAMGFFAANMERKLRLLFAPEYGWALDSILTSANWSFFRDFQMFQPFSSPKICCVVHGFQPFIGWFVPWNLYRQMREPAIRCSAVPVFYTHRNIYCIARA